MDNFFLNILLAAYGLKAAVYHVQNLLILKLKRAFFFGAKTFNFLESNLWCWNWTCPTLPLGVFAFAAKAGNGSWLASESYWPAFNNSASFQNIQYIYKIYKLE